MQNIISIIKSCQIKFTSVRHVAYCYISKDQRSGLFDVYKETLRWTIVIVGNFPNRFSIAAFSNDVCYLLVSTERERIVRVLSYVFCNPQCLYNYGYISRWIVSFYYPMTWEDFFRFANESNWQVNWIGNFEEKIAGEKLML